ncbi:PucR family transcriptional regulator [Pseudonocardia nematodicida]|uniref:PucR family transcriptional regulator n=1 Tax=Pseudonocardia nematodicida TaxID=1206997 RepID=A0ABV1K4Q9_9PSEU
MLLSELVADLGLRVLHGPGDSLARRVRWVYTTDLPDPSRYLGGGELVLSGLVWHHGPDDSERFVAAVAGAGATALAAGEAAFGEVPADVVDACRRHGLVLLAVPVDVSFGVVTEAVVGALSAARGDRLAHSLGRHRRLLGALAAGAELDELTAEVSAGTGLTCRVLTAGGLVLAGPPLPDPARDALVAAFLTADRLPATAGRHLLVPAGSAISRAAGWLIAAELPGPGRAGGAAPGGAGSGPPDGAAGPGTPHPTARAGAPDGAGRSGPPGGAPEPDPDLVDAVGELAAIAALDRARRRERAAVARPIADDALARTADGEGDRPETRVRLRQAGLEPDGALIVLVLRATGTPEPAGTAVALLTDALADAGPAVVGVHDGAAVAVLAADPPTRTDRGAGPRSAAPAPVSWPDSALAALHRLAPGLGGWRLHAGVSHPSASDALSGALGEALHAAGLAATRPGPVTSARAGEITSHVALLAGVPDDVRRGYAAQVLGPVREHDARSGTGLVATLETFLDESGSWSRTAARLHLHVNTVRYRIGRVEELTGRDLGRFTDRVDLYLALARW